MNRLTKQISLVLISSSLILHGCERHLTEEEKKEEEARVAVGGTGRTTGYHGGSHFFYGGGRSAPGSSGAVAHPSVGGSARGGFGSSFHGVSS